MKFLIIRDNIINLKYLKYIKYDDECDDFEYAFESEKYHFLGVNEYIFIEFKRFLLSTDICFNMDNRVTYSTEQEREYLERKKND